MKWYFILKIAQNLLTWVLFDADVEFDIPRFHVSRMSHVTPEQGCQIKKKLEIAQNKLTRVLFVY